MSTYFYPVAASPAPAAVARPRRLHPAVVPVLYVAWTLFAVFVYSRYSQLGDAESYMTGAYAADPETQARTLFVTKLAARLSALGGALGAHLAFSLFAATGIAYMVWQANAHGRHRWPLLVLLLLPNFGVWTAVIGREALFTGLLGLFLGALIGYYRRGGLYRILLALLCVGGMVFLRGPFGMGAGLLLLGFLVIVWGPSTRLSAGVQALMLAGVAALAVALLWPQLDRYITEEVLPKARSYFTIHSPTTRLWVEMDTSGDLFGSLWWSLPLALLGPTPGEVLARPVMLPFFLSGLIVIGLLLHGIRQALFRAPAGLPRKILMLGWLPAMLVVLIAYVPFGIYNPGSGIRYAATFLLLLVFPSMLLSAVDTEAADALDAQAEDPHATEDE